MANNKIVVNEIIKFSNVDGPGNRYTIFTQGCNINCTYCHNFETINFCNHCMECVKHCESSALTILNNKVHYNKSKCTNCNKCIIACPNSSTPKTTLYTVNELVDEINKYKLFLKGITISGGECTLQYKGVIELFKEVKKHTDLSCYIDTNGYFDIEQIWELVELTDKFMIDIKGVHSTKNIIGKNETERNLENLKKLLEIHKVEEVRTVVTNDSQYFAKTVEAVANIIKDYDVKYKIIKMKDHSIGEKQNHLKTLIPTNNDIDEYLKVINNNGVKNVEVI